MSRDRSSLVAGAVLVALGLVLLVLQFAQGLGQAVTFFLIGGLFIAAYFYRRSYGLLIPGGILLGLGLGSLGENAPQTWGDLSAVGLGIGFVSIYAIARIHEGRTHWWPLVPGMILIASGLSSGNNALERLLSVGWPLILILIGLLLVAGVLPRSRRGDPTG